MIVSTIWTCLAVVGWVVQLALLIETVEDRTAMRAAGRNGALALLARHHIAVAGRRLVVITGNVLIGVGSLVFPAPPSLSRGTAIFGAIAAAWLIVNEAIQVWASWGDRRVRLLIEQVEH